MTANMLMPDAPPDKDPHLLALRVAAQLRLR